MDMQDKGLDAAIASKAKLLQKLLTKKDYSQALRLAEELAPHAEQSQDIAHLCALAFTQNGDAARAQTYFDKALLAAPENPLLHLNLAQLHTRSGDLARAERAYKSATSLDPNLAPAHAGLAQLAAAEGKLGQAEELFLTALRADPNDMTALLGLGHLHADRGQNDQAMQRAQKLLKLAPNDHRVATLMGRVLLASGQLAFAAKSLDNALARDPHYYAALLLRAQVALRQGDLNVAEAMLRKAAAQNAESLVLRMTRAELSLRLQRTEQVIADLDWVLARRPGFMQALQLRTAIDMRLQRGQAALQRLQHAAQVLPRDINVNHYFLRTLLELGLSPQARQASQAWCDRAPNFAAAQNHLAAIEEAHGELDKAQLAAEAALALDPKQVQSAIILARAKLRAGRPSEALTLLTQAGSQPMRDESKIELERLRGRALDAKGDRLGALTAWQQAAALAPAAPKLPVLAPVSDGPEIASDATGRRVAQLHFVVSLPFSGAEPLLSAMPDSVSLFDRYMAEPRKDFINSTAADRLLLPFSASDVEHVASRYLKALQRRLPKLPADALVFDVLPILDVRQFRVLRRALPNAKWVIMERDPRDCLLAALANGAQELALHQLEQTVQVLDRQYAHLQRIASEAGDACIRIPALGKADFPALEKALGLRTPIDQERFKRACLSIGELPMYFPAQRWQAFDALKSTFAQFSAL
jgi:tetratricopeptide (TPR) repeat protein